MIPLPQIIKKNGFGYTQVSRGKKTCVYAQWYKNNIIAYEVFIIRIRPNRCIKGEWLEAREKFPADEDLGYHAWVYKTLERAEEKYNSLEND